ncbi:hypothetical protein DXG01_008112 [Tephrocybe rancida]|nr:hypothetical protein DXG01_008112 [Tephrocybe rancida]
MLFFVLASLFCLVASTRAGGFDIPIQRHDISSDDELFKRGDGKISGITGLGNNADVLYTVPIQLGNSVTAVNLGELSIVLREHINNAALLDTGSSDLWVVTDACGAGTCKGASVGRYPSSKERPSGTNITLLYGDSTTGTSASGIVGLDTASVATVAMADQPLGLINSTDNPIVQFGAAGIFGLGFPAGSKIQEARVIDKFGPITTTDDFIQATYTDGPLLARMAVTGELESPMFSITLQRSTIDIGGSGQLTIGKLPDGVDNSSMTWVPVRLYTAEDGGLAAPTFAPNEARSSTKTHSPNSRWEIDIDGVFLDGQKIADSTIPPTDVNPGRVTALIDSGNSIIRGPQDVVNNILQSVSPGFNPANTDVEPQVPCAVPHTLAFQIGGKMFPVDPRDLISPGATGDTTTCIADNLVGTDAPRLGSLFSWSLGDPFMKSCVALSSVSAALRSDDSHSNLVAFYFGNLTHPSVDPPRIGFLSTVPANADELLTQAVQDAQNNGNTFEHLVKLTLLAETLVVAPTASAAAQPQLTVTPVAGFTARATTLSGMTTRTVGQPSATSTEPSKGTLNKENSGQEDRAA